MNNTKGLESLKIEVEGRDKKTVLNFEDFAAILRQEPERVLRNIFQLFHDMVKARVIGGKDEYPDDPESIGFLPYDCSKIFAERKDNPFFPDRLLANRFVEQVDDFKRGAQQNQMNVYVGPPGCGKSTFLNNLLQTFEEYTRTKEGQSLEIFWKIKTEQDEFEVPCPSHDHPVLIIPRDHRAAFLDGLLCDKPEFRKRIAREKEYDWLFSGRVCTICESIFQALCDKSCSLEKVLEMIRVRPYRFNRRLGEGISIFNPGDKPPPPREMFLSDKQIQEKLDQFFGTDRVRYVFSQLAKTNNGIYVLMDIKSHNKERLLELHNVISEGVWKVAGLEEETKSLFFALMNPEDKKAIESEKMESFQARIRYSKISYVLEPQIEVEIYRSIFGKQIDLYFLPRVLENFVRVIISSRMNLECAPLKEWIPDLQPYVQKRYCDRYGLLLRMEIYHGIIPSWISEEDQKRFIAPVRRNLIGEAVNEGDKGFSGRDSIRHFSELLKIYGPKPNEPKTPLITMANVIDYFKNKLDRKTSSDNIPQSFLESLVSWYNYVVLNEVKEALYFYNKEQIQGTILNYLSAINHDPDGRKIQCKYTSKEIEVTVDFFKLVGSYILGQSLDDRRAVKYAQDIQKRYAEMLARDRTKPIAETELYQELFSSYVRNLKEGVLQPFIRNDNFRQAVKAFGTEEFDTFDTRHKEYIVFMIKNLVDKFGYTEQGAKEICLYVLDERLAKEFK